MITIASWNINSVRLRMPLVEHFLREEAPDVLCLQEIKCQEPQFPYKAFADLGYRHAVVHGQKGYHGVATVSRLPITEFSRHDWQDNGEARHVGVEIGGAGQGMVLENVYVPAGGDIPDREVNAKFGQKLDFLGRMTRWAESVDRPTLIVGGFQHRAAGMRCVEPQAIAESGEPHAAGSGNAATVQGCAWLVRYRGATIFWSRNAITAGGATARRIGAPMIAAAGSTICGLPPILPGRRGGHRVLEDARGWTQPSDHVPLITEFDL